MMSVLHNNLELTAISLLVQFSCSNKAADLVHLRFPYVNTNAKLVTCTHAPKRDLCVKIHDLCSIPVCEVFDDVVIDVT